VHCLARGGVPHRRAQGHGSANRSTVGLSGRFLRETATSGSAKYLNSHGFLGGLSAGSSRRPASAIKSGSLRLMSDENSYRLVGYIGRCGSA